MNFHIDTNQMQLFLELLTKEVASLRQEKIMARIVGEAEELKRRIGAEVDPAYETWAKTEEAKHLDRQAQRGKPLSDLLGVDSTARDLTDETFNPRSMTERTPG